jgi:signal transduction histidine kinase
LKTRDLDEAQRKNFYDVMLADSDRLLQTVELVLRAGSVGQRKRQLNITVVDVGEILEDCLNIARTRYNLTPESLTYTKNLNGDTACVAGDADELRGAVSNLLDNAVKYSDKKVQLSVELASLDQKNIAVSIADQGIGIPATQLKRIFKRFYRVPGRVMARFKGTGLGLFIVRSVIEKHGGKVFAESPGPGQGSTFTIQLPRA